MLSYLGACKLHPSRYSRTWMAGTCRDRRWELTHRWVRATPSLTNFKGVHMYFMFTMDTSFYRWKLLSAHDICHLCQFNHLHARVRIISDTCLRKVNTLISMHICTCWSMHLLSHLLSWFSCLVILLAMTYKLAWMFKTKMQIQLTPTQSDARLNPVSTQCRATFASDETSFKCRCPDRRTQACF